MLNNSNYDNFHGGGEFSHAYVIMYKYFGKKSKMQKKWVHKLLFTIYHFFLHENFLHILPTLGATNSKLSEYKTFNQMEKKKSFSLLPFQNEFCTLQKLYIIYYLIKCII